MSDHTKIEWADATVNAVNGCSVCSPGCTNCYAMRLAGTRMKHHPTREGLTTDTKAGPVWNGTVRLHEPALLQPLRWKRPRRIFWNAHGDLFHESVPDEWIDRVFAVCALTPQHTHMILTKRSARMRKYVISRRALSGNIGGEAVALALEDGRAEYGGVSTTFPLKAAEVREAVIDRIYSHNFVPNVWLGVSVEDQARADERIPDLLATPAAVRFISAEPLLGPVDLTDLALGRREPRDATMDALGGDVWDEDGERGAVAKLDWVIAGGESGPHARPMHPDWARSLRDQCAAAGAPFHFKQWGEWAPICALDDSYYTDFYERRPLGRDPEGPRRCIKDQMTMQASGRIFPIDQWSRIIGEDPASRDFAYEQGKGGMHFFRCGKARAGRLLDGVDHSEFPA